MSDEGAAAKLLDERPDLADALETVLDVDQRRERWSFDDVPVDSGHFGELVSRDVVDEADGGYRLSDPAAVRAALGREDDGETGRPTTADLATPSVSLPTVDRTTAAIVAAALAVVALVRVHTLGSVYRNGDVVLSGNDPYYYRYLVEQAIASGANPLDPSALSTFPQAVQKGEPLMVATLWWVAALLGDGARVVGDVLAWYPVVSAVLTAVVVYLLAVRVTDDRRVGLAAVLIFAFVPGHAMRTSLGFADHHAFDYPWLAATALLVATLAGVDRERLRDSRTWLLSAGLGVAVAGQTLAWEAGPLLIAPLGLVVVATALVDVRDGRSPLVRGVPVLAGVGVGALLTALVHVVVGWHTAVVAFAPALLFAGSLGALAVAEAVHRASGDVRHLAGVDAAAAVAGLLVLRFALTDFWTTLVDRLDVLLRNDAIAETQSLFDPDAFGFLFLFGFTLVIALPAMAVGVRRAVDDGRWLVATAYAWYFFLLATVQARFAGELATFAAVFAGVGLVWVAAWIDAAAPFDERVRRLRVPDRGQLATLAVLFLLLTSFGAVQVGVKTSQVTTGDGAYRSAAFVADRSAELNQTYPENYVLSEWGDSRMYNYFVSGESRGYGYAQSNFGEFARSPDPDSWYDRFAGRVGYVVFETGRDVASPITAYSQLTETYGSATDDGPGLAHYRALYLPPDESRVVFGVVPGAAVTGTAPANGTVELSTNVSIPRAEFDYVRRATAASNGTYRVRVAYPGTYRVQVGNQTRRVTVNESAVRSGTAVEA